jgi:glycosyltransferase involved in cell wall biosynthesis
VTQQAPKVSVIIAAYRPGEAVHRVIDSLDAQTLPQDEFEVIFVDDGSPDDTYARLQGFAATRPNMQVYRIENSGWPSRPRNVGIGHARGEYVLFMDHDDSLFPDGLRRAYEYAIETDADLLSPKESKTNDPWWGLSRLTDGNVPNALVDGGVERLLPMVPHKFYRRQVLLDYNIFFPEGARILWEDIFINIGVYRHAKAVAVLADTPVYLWHASSMNSSHTFNPAREDFWDRLEDVMRFIAVTLDHPDYREARAVALAHQVKVRVIDRLVRMLVKVKPSVALMPFARARRLLAEYVSDDVFAALPKKHQAQAYLLRAGQNKLMQDFHQADLAQRSRTVVRKVSWPDGILRLDLECTWYPKDKERPILRRDGERVMRIVDDSLAWFIPPRLLDVTDDPAAMRFDVCIRRRRDPVSWNVPATIQDAGFAEDDDGNVCVKARATATLDIDSGAVGAPLADDVWDFRVRSTWAGMARLGVPHYDGPARPAVRDGRAAIAYSNASKGLSLDLAQRLRTLAIDAKPRSGIAGPITGFSAPLDNVATFGATTLDAGMVVAIPDDAVPANLDDEQAVQVLEKLAKEGELGARVVANADGTRFEGGAALPAGRYTLYARREGKLHATKRSITVDDVGQAQFD